MIRRLRSHDSDSTELHRGRAPFEETRYRHVTYINLFIWICGDESTSLGIFEVGVYYCIVTVDRI